MTLQPAVMYCEPSKDIEESSALFNKGSVSGRGQIKDDIDDMDLIWLSAVNHDYLL